MFKRKQQTLIIKIKLRDTTFEDIVAEFKDAAKDVWNYTKEPEFFDNETNEIIKELKQMRHMQTIKVKSKKKTFNFNLATKDKIPREQANLCLALLRMLLTSKMTEPLKNIECLDVAINAPLRFLVASTKTKIFLAISSPLHTDLQSIGFGPIDQVPHKSSNVSSKENKFHLLFPQSFQNYNSWQRISHINS